MGKSCHVACLVLHNLIIKSELKRGRDASNGTTWRSMVSELGVPDQPYATPTQDEYAVDTGDDDLSPEGKVRREELVQFILQAHPLKR